MFLNFVHFTSKYSFYAFKSDALTKTFIEEIPRWYEKTIGVSKILEKKTFSMVFFYRGFWLSRFSRLAGKYNNESG